MKGWSALVTTRVSALLQVQDLWFPPTAAIMTQMTRKRRNHMNYNAAPKQNRWFINVNNNSCVFQLIHARMAAVK